MNFYKINIYLLSQICKYFFLILFIFLSIAWLLQITRLFTISNFMHIEVWDILILSFYLIPNIITVILPFILIFGLLLCFIKLNKDNELIAILSLGFGLNPFKITLIFFSFITLIIFTILNFYLAPIVYEKYKFQEYDLRNTIDLKNMGFSNFLNINKTTILDFKKKNNEYQEILISFNDEKENIVYAKKGNIYTKNNQYNFQLTDGFKISIDSNNQIEKLEFLNYVLKFDNRSINYSQIVDKNTFTIFDDFKNSNYLNITFKLFDLLLILFVIYLFYSNNIKNVNFNTKNNIYFLFFCISILIVNQILKNSEINIMNYSIIILSLIISSLVISILKNKYVQN